MPSFNYRATNIEGQVTEGSIEAIEESVVVKNFRILVISLSALVLKKR